MGRPSKFSPEFKERAIRMVREQRPQHSSQWATITWLTTKLGCTTETLRRWVQECAADTQQAFPGQGQMKPEQAELARLRREVIKLKAERDILKKAAAYFAKEAL